MAIFMLISLGIEKAGWLDEIHKLLREGDFVGS